MIGNILSVICHKNGVEIAMPLRQMHIIGKVTIASDIAIGANSVVTKSFEEGGITIAGVPAEKISDNNSHANLAPGLKLD